MDGMQRVINSVVQHVTSEIKAGKSSTAEVTDKVANSIMKEIPSLKSDNKTARVALGSAVVLGAGLVGLAGLGATALAGIIASPVLVPFAMGFITGRAIHMANEKLKSTKAEEKTDNKTDNNVPSRNDLSNDFNSGKLEQKKLTVEEQREVVNKLFEDENFKDLPIQEKEQAMDKALEKATQKLNGESVTELKDNSIQEKPHEESAQTQNTTSFERKKSSTGTIKGNYNEVAISLYDLENTPKEIKFDGKDYCAWATSKGSTNENYESCIYVQGKEDHENNSPMNILRIILNMNGNMLVAKRDGEDVNPKELQGILKNLGN